MSRLAWYARRLSTMSPAEMAWHVRRHAAVSVELARSDDRADQSMLLGDDVCWNTLLDRFRSASDRPVLLDRDRALRVLADEPTAVDELLAEAELLLAGKRRYFGHPVVDVGNPIDWNHDPIAGRRWPAAPARSINHRNAVSDPKWIWELNRLQHLPILAQAWLFTGADRFAEAALDQLDSWLVQNPFGTGIAWRGAFEAGVRAISVAVAVQGLRTSPALTVERFRAIVRMLDASARYCWYGRSLFSSANNHLIGELTGLLTVHLLLPELAAPARLAGGALELLAAEADKQILPDGSGSEQSVSYQVFVAELLSLTLLLVQMSSDAPPELAAALARSGDYLADLVGVDDPDPRYGDDDDGFALRLGAEDKRTIRQHLGITSTLAGSAKTSRAGRPTLTAAWFAAAHDGPPCATGATGPFDGSFYARFGGVAVLRSDKRRITMDVGGLGYLSIAAHGHADALALTVSENGHDLIVDPGTASYYGHPNWRLAHRGTRAHATVAVDGADQSMISGPFSWSRHAVCDVHAFDAERGVVDAEHDGYRRLDDPVTHRRWLISPPADATIAVVDLVAGRRPHDVQLSWPLHPSLDVADGEDGHLAKRCGVGALRLWYAASAHLRTFGVRGDPVSQFGWYSDRLEARTPSWVVGAQVTGGTPIAILTLIRTRDLTAIADPRITIGANGITARWTEDHDPRTVWIDTRTGGGVRSDVESRTSTAKEEVQPS